MNIAPASDHHESHRDPAPDPDVSADATRPGNAARASGAAHPAPAPRPRLSTAWWGLLIRAIVAFAMLTIANYAAAFAFTPLHDALVESGPVEQGLAVVANFTVVGVIVVLLVWAWMRLVERRPLRTAGWRFDRATLGWLGLGVLASVVVVAASIAIAILVVPPGEPLPEGGAGGMDAVPVWLVVLIIIARAFFLQGIPEELLYRGWLFSMTRERPMLTLAWTTIAFTVIHLTSSGGQQSALEHVLYLAIPLGFGALSGAMVLLTGSMWTAAGVHAGFHVAMALTEPFLTTAPTPADWIVIGAVYLVATAIVLAIWNSRRRRAHDSDASGASGASDVTGASGGTV